MINVLFKDKENNKSYALETVKVWGRGIYIEVPTEKVPKKVKDLKLGGCGVISEIKGTKYFVSNTSGELFKKTFQLKYELPIFELKGKKDIKRLVSDSLNLEEGINILKKCFDRELIFDIRKGYFDDMYDINKFKSIEEFTKAEKADSNTYYKLILDLEKSDFEVLKHELENIDCFNEMLDAVYKEDRINKSISISFVFIMNKDKESEFKKGHITSKNANELLKEYKLNKFKWKII